MTSVLITGDGFPLYRVLSAVLEMPNMSVAGLILGSTSSANAKRLANESGLPQWPLAILQGTAPFPDELAADWLVNINGTTIIGPGVIARFRGRAINMHPGQLPQYAGMHCHQWAIRNGEHVQGVTVHLMEEGIDTGAILSQRSLTISPQDTGLSLFRRTMEEGTQLLVELIERIAANNLPAAVPQDLSRRHLYRHRDALDGTLDWTWNGRQIVDFVRAANYEPLTCPTYTPLALLGRAEVVLRSCEAVEDHANVAPGTIIRVTPNPVIACRAGAVRITRALHDGAVVMSSDWPRLIANVA